MSKSSPHPTRSADQNDGDPECGSQRPLTPEAKRALAEAAARREAQSGADPEQDNHQPKEIGGRKGPDPARFGDWENGGIVSDF